jgi:hypothetical protein
MKYRSEVRDIEEEHNDSTNSEANNYKHDGGVRIWGYVRQI